MVRLGKSEPNAECVSAHGERLLVAGLRIFTHRQDGLGAYMTASDDGLDRNYASSEALMHNVRSSIALQEHSAR